MRQIENGKNISSSLIFLKPDIGIVDIYSFEIFIFLYWISAKLEWFYLKGFLSNYRNGMEIGNYTNADWIQKIFELICSWYVIFCQEIILLGKNLIFILYYVTERNK